MRNINQRNNLGIYARGRSEEYITSISKLMINCKYTISILFLVSKGYELNDYRQTIESA